MSIHNIISDIVEHGEYPLDVRIYENEVTQWDCYFTWRGRPNYHFTLRVELDFGEYTVWVKIRTSKLHTTIFNFLVS